MLALTLVFAVAIFVFFVAFSFRLRGWIRDMRRDIYTVRNEVRELRVAGGRMSELMADAAAESLNAASIGALRFDFPVFFGGWSIDSFLGRFLIQHLLESKPKCIVELGSGSSTILMARTLSLLRRDDVIHIACDHEEKYLSITRENARLNGVEDRIEFHHCPLVKNESLEKLWYSGVPELLAGRKIDLLLIDGPPGPLQHHSRYPAMPILSEHLAEHCTVVLDDAIREQETEIAKLWVNAHPDFSLEISKSGHGAAILRR